jgi:hypothetical protein
LFRFHRNQSKNILERQKLFYIRPELLFPNISRSDKYFGLVMPEMRVTARATAVNLVFASAPKAVDDSVCSFPVSCNDLLNGIPTICDSGTRGRRGIIPTLSIVAHGKEYPLFHRLDVVSGMKNGVKGVDF